MGGLAHTQMSSEISILPIISLVKSNETTDCILLTIFIQPYFEVIT